MIEVFFLAFPSKDFSTLIVSKRKNQKKESTKKPVNGSTVDYFLETNTIPNRKMQENIQHEIRKTCHTFLFLKI